MLFSRTYRYSSSMPVEDIKGRLVGKHVTVHNLDFEVFEKDRQIKIIPHAESIQAIKTLPITHIELNRDGNKTKVVISSKMRKIDQGGPLLIVVFCVFMLIGGIVAYNLRQEMVMYASLLGISLVLFTIFWYRMEAGYFDYVRKIRDYIKKESVVA